MYVYTVNVFRSTRFRSAVDRIRLCGQVQIHSEGFLLPTRYARTGIRTVVFIVRRFNARHASVRVTRIRRERSTNTMATRREIRRDDVIIDWLIIRRNVNCSTIHVHVVTFRFRQHDRSKCRSAG